MMNLKYTQFQNQLPYLGFKFSSKNFGQSCIEFIQMIRLQIKAQSSSLYCHTQWRERGTLSSELDSDHLSIFYLDELYATLLSACCHLTKLSYPLR